MRQKIPFIRPDENTGERFRIQTNNDHVHEESRLNRNVIANDVERPESENVIEAKVPQTQFISTKKKRIEKERWK